LRSINDALDKDNVLREVAWLMLVESERHEFALGGVRQADRNTVCDAVSLCSCAGSLRQADRVFRSASSDVSDMLPVLTSTNVLGEDVLLLKAAAWLRCEESERRVLALTGLTRSDRNPACAMLFLCSST